MAFLTTNQRAAITTAVDTDEVTADLWRSPAMAAGKVGARVDTGTNIPVRIRPGGEDDSNFQRIPLAQPLNSTRQYFVGKVALSADVRAGTDELRVGTTRYQVEGVGAFTNAKLLALSTGRSGT
jgi:hypothetical protein